MWTKRVVRVGQFNLITMMSTTNVYCSLLKEHPPSKECPPPGPSVLVEFKKHSLERYAYLR